jgi:hypothetical protein
MVIKTLDIQNPFADYGNIIEGNRFVGRQYAIKSIHNRVLGSSYGNLAVIGLPKIGKSCLVWNALMVKKSELVKRNILIERISVSTIDSSYKFFNNLLCKALSSIRIQDKSLYKQLNTIHADYLVSHSDSEIELFFALIKSNNYRLIYILDEFDTIIRFFGASEFQFLRELSINPDTKVCLVTISRHTIEELEVRSYGSSTFHQVLTPLHLGMFSEEDMSFYWSYFTSLGIEFHDEYKNKIRNYVGNHPFLLDLLNYHIFNTLCEDRSLLYDKILESTESELRLNLYQAYNSAMNLLKEENLDSKVIQVILGPIFDVKLYELEKLLKFQFIKSCSIKEKIDIIGNRIGLENSDRKTSYVCFSNYFTEYLKLTISETNFWPLWSDTERNVRSLLKQYIEQKFGEDWETQYIIVHRASEGKIKEFQKLIDERARALKKFGSLASNHLIDYTYPGDMYNLFISADWIWFKNVFGDPQKDWGARFNLLAEIRNPFAHNNHEFVNEKKLTDGKFFCNAINERISIWKEGVISI